MSDSKSDLLFDHLSKRTSIFGLRVWVLVAICLGASFVMLLFSVSMWIIYRRSSSGNTRAGPRKTTLSNASTSIPEICHECTQTSVAGRVPVPVPILVTERSLLLPSGKEKPISFPVVHTETGKNNGITCLEKSWDASSGSSHEYNENYSVEEVAVNAHEVLHLGWGRWYTLRELEDATNGFNDENVIGEGGYGIVYRGVLEDNTVIAVKNLLNKRGQAEKEFKVEVETIGRIRHKNLVKLLGYCVEGAYRMLVYEYVDNGNLEQWLHDDSGPWSPLSWDVRMNIVLGTAKGLTYLHEGLEPKIVHRDIKSSNILLDKQWNPKVSDFGLAKLLGSDRSHVTTRVMGTFGYVAPEYASTGMLNELSDVYSFGILIMEIISGRNPVDCSRPQGEVNLLEWLKTMIRNGNTEDLLDPRIAERPSSRALKRALLVSLRCVDPDAQKRPKMGRVLHMLEADDFSFQR